MWPAAGTKEDQVREIVCLRSACPGLLHSHEVVRRLILAIEKDVPVTNALDIDAATNDPARRSAVAASCRCAGKICHGFERGSNMVCVRFLQGHDSVNTVRLWFAFCLHNKKLFVKSLLMVLPGPRARFLFLAKGFCKIKRNLLAGRKYVSFENLGY